LTILVDANLLIYAYNRAATQHETAKDWLEARLAGHEPIGLPWPSLLAFLRIVTHPRLFPNRRSGA
jgi:predicted nucleic acid-binding protein